MKKLVAEVIPYPLWCKELRHGLLLDKQIAAPSPFYGEAAQYALSPRPWSLPAARIGFASTNRLIDPKWNTELINTVLMRVCCSITCHLNHRAEVPLGHLLPVIHRASRKFALSFREEDAIIINISPCALCQACRSLFFLITSVLFYLGLKIAAFLFPPVLTTSYSYILNEVPWMSQMKSKCKPID